MPESSDPSSTSLSDVKQLGLIAAIASLSYVFWVVGAMEMVERLAFYGVKALTDTLYQAHHIHLVWTIVGCVGILTALGIYLYGRWILTLHRQENEIQ